MGDAEGHQARKSQKIFGAQVASQRHVVTEQKRRDKINEGCVGLSIWTRGGMTSVSGVHLLYGADRGVRGSCKPLGSIRCYVMSRWTALLEDNIGREDLVSSRDTKLKPTNKADGLFTRNPAS